MAKWLLGGFLLSFAFGVRTVEAQTVTYIHTDALGSVVAVTNSAGQEIERREYEPYGEQLLPTLSDGPGYTGHVQDAATGLTYMQQRYYDPEIGRFLSVDPVTADPNTGAHFNRYVYAYNNPYRFSDPDGRIPVAIAACAASPPCAAAAIATGAFVTYKVQQALNIALPKIERMLNEAGESPAETSQEAIDKIKEGTRPADGQAGLDGVLVGDGGAEGQAAAVDIARGTDGAKVLVDKPGATVVQLPDGRKVEAHTSTKGGQYQGAPTVKIQDQDGKVSPPNIIRYPEPRN